MSNGMNTLEVRLSVALVTRNRPDSLRRTLSSLRDQDVQPWEVVVSDDSDDAQAAATEAVVCDFGCRYIRGPRRGLYANRNHVALACRGTHIRTMDDDHEFPPGHIEACVAAAESDPASIWVIGEYPVMEEGVARDYETIRPLIIVGEYGPDNVPDVPTQCPGQLNAWGISEAPADPQQCWAISDGASVYPRDIFERNIRYMDQYPFGASYLEFGSRLYWLGYRMRHMASTYVVHHYHPLTRSYLSLDVDLSSRTFSMLCHSFIYQPSWKNKATTVMGLIKTMVKHRGSVAKPLRDGIREYRRQQRDIHANKSSRTFDMAPSVQGEA